jgi:hypothetical protein
MHKPVPHQPYSWNARDRAYLYMSATRNQFGIARVDLAVRNRGLIGASLIAALLVAALLAVSAVFWREVAAHTDATVTLFLIVPGLLGYLVVRPSEHPLVAKLLGGVRLLTLFAGALPVVGALALLAHDSDRIVRSPSGDLAVLPMVPDMFWWWLGLAIAAGITSIALFCSWVLPIRETD